MAWRERPVGRRIVNTETAGAARRPNVQINRSSGAIYRVIPRRGAIPGAREGDIRDVADLLGQSLLGSTKKRLDAFPPNRRRQIIKAVLSEGKITARKPSALNIETGKPEADIVADWEKAVRELGGDPLGPDVEINKDRRFYQAPDETIVQTRRSRQNGPTLEMQLPERYNGDEVYLIKIGTGYKRSHGFVFTHHGFGGRALGGKAGFAFSSVGPGSELAR